MSGVYHEHFTRKREETTGWREKFIPNYLTCLDRLVRELHNEVDSLTDKAMIISPNEQRAFDFTKHCPKVRDHSHICGRYRGPLVIPATVDYQERIGSSYCFS